MDGIFNKTRFAMKRYRDRKRIEETHPTKHKNERKKLIKKQKKV